MEMLKGMLRNNKVLAMIAAALVALMATIAGVNKDDIKSAYCGEPQAVAAPLMQEK